jgi:hypothetical protein
MKLINNPHFKASITLLILLIIFWLTIINPEIMGIFLISLFVITVVGGIYMTLYSLFDEDL